MVRSSRPSDASERAPSKGTETRAAVLGEALSHASVVGLRGVTIGALAEKAGLSKSGLFAHFKSKETLQLAILEEAITRFIARVVVPALREPRGKPRVAALLARWQEWSKADFMPGGCIFVSAMAEADDLEPAVRARLCEAQLDWVDTLTQAIRIAKDERHFRADLDAAQLAHELVALAYGSHLFARLVSRAPTAAQRSGRGLETRFEHAVERLFRDASRAA